eukprot:92931-Hanusia_phi.AAC.1
MQQRRSGYTFFDVLHTATAHASLLQESGNRSRGEDLRDPSEAGRPSDIRGMSSGGVVALARGAWSFV